jgi:hypothetical protein
MNAQKATLDNRIEVMMPSLLIAVVILGISRAACAAHKLATISPDSITLTSRPIATGHQRSCHWSTWPNMMKEVASTGNE